MDYASDIDELGLPVRRKRRGDMSFMVIAIGTVCLAAAWVLTASDPYTELANRVEVQPGVSAENTTSMDLFDLAAAPADNVAAVPDAPAVAAPERATTTASPHILPGEEVVITAPGEFIGPLLPGGEVVETSLALTRAERRTIQRRLAMAGHDPGSPDGVFGPMTREAITAYEKQWGFPEDGYIDRAMLNSLVERSEPAYAVWAEEQKAHKRRSRQATRVRPAPAPAARQAAAAPGDCARKSDGSVVGYQSVGCDLRGFGEGLRDLVSGRLPSGSGSELEAAAGIDR